MKRNPGGRNQESFLSHVFTFPRRAQTWQEHKVSVKCANASQEQNTASAGIWIWNLQQSSWPWGSQYSDNTLLSGIKTLYHGMGHTMYCSWSLTLIISWPLSTVDLFCCQQLENICTYEVVCCDAALLVQLVWALVNPYPSQWAPSNVWNLCEMIFKKCMSSVLKNHISTQRQWQWGL